MRCAAKARLRRAASLCPATRAREGRYIAVNTLMLSDARVLSTSALALLLATAAAETTKEITLSNGVAMPIVAYGTWHCACARAAFRCAFCRDHSRETAADWVL